VASKPNPVLSYVVNNVIVRTITYYVLLFATWAGVSRLSYVKAITRGSMDQLLGGSSTAASREVLMTGGAAVQITETTLAVSVTFAMVGAVALALPVAWIYSLTRQKRGYQQSVVQTLMVLPPLVAGVVGLVKYSLPLAFGLAGIVAAVRFRNTLEDSKDAVYVFLATAIGLSAGVQLPVAAVISGGFNLIILFLWLTDFGKPAAFEGARAKQRMEDARQRMRQTGSFVAMLDNEIFEKMTPEQLEVAADRAWKRRRQLEATDAPDDDEMQRRDVLLRVRTGDPGSSRAAIEGVFDEFLKKWRYVGISHEADGTHYLEYAVQLKKTAKSEDFETALNNKKEVLAAEFK